MTLNYSERTKLISDGVRIRECRRVLDRQRQFALLTDSCSCLKRNFIHGFGVDSGIPQPSVRAFSYDVVTGTNSIGRYFRLSRLPCCIVHQTLRATNVAQHTLAKLLLGPAPRICHESRSGVTHERS